ncbi:putative mitochondrial hypothetical protein [Leptomonas pyrrhocoris]|uniref:Letm1 RBD domain-containing protein n=1 Tax=Leptomonas pyrrhocoris TaxID=157538 RepID=A0A0M9FXX6_LEPPY|nr:putative mitochondrial hypothetical protein [Leptomonas pyrrhocoris]XP_015656794.1 putative mitochondrial hypothetical protein [Leptomonas pyrrhocoris]KPA78354.1 putative mitochondrial hypothetical protein [Leptomonas pyrrhocoris]KPA78355.1 putative mitochondrial hypothetical protein [Leptomonas pyrrhocoris]|eukprot:XP_015656793.1 putative mitochondrial hypothetical protein [Leptomonas pyrrhocoris]
MQGTWAVLKKNCVNFLPGAAAFASQSREAFATWLKIYNRGYTHGPQDFYEQHETYSPDYWKRGHSQDKNMWVDMKLSEEVSQKDIAQLMHYKQDLWRVAHGVGLTAFIGGYAIVPLFFWLASNTFAPSVLNVTEEEKKEWRAAQDLYRYRSAPSYIMDTKWFFDFHAYPWNATQERGWDELFEKNNVRRDAKTVRPAAEMYDGFIKLETIRRKSLRHLARSMNLPTFPMLVRLCASTRVKDYWNLAFNEDYMVITQRLHEQMSDEDLYDYAWRRFLAPYDKNLSRDEVMTRVSDYHEFLGPKFVEEGKAPNLIILTNYCMGYYNDPAYLEEDIAELEGNDYEYMAHYGKDAFLRRLEFENGPLRDQVEAHTQKLIEERAAAAKAEADAKAAPQVSA